MDIKLMYIPNKDKLNHQYPKFLSQPMNELAFKNFGYQYNLRHNIPSLPGYIVSVQFYIKL